MGKELLIDASFVALVRCHSRQHPSAAFLDLLELYPPSPFVPLYQVVQATAYSVPLFTDSSSAIDQKGSKSTSRIFLYLVGPNTFVPIAWACKKQRCVSHSSTEAELVALDAGLRM